MEFLNEKDIERIENSIKEFKFDPIADTYEVVIKEIELTRINAGKQKTQIRLVIDTCEEDFL